MNLSIYVTLMAATPVQRQSEVEKIYNESGYVEAVCYLWDKVLDVESRLEAEDAVAAHNKSNIFYKLFVTDFNIKEHFSQVHSHRWFVKKAFWKLKTYLKYMNEEDTDNHDLSKFKLVEAVGFTARWVHGSDNRSWKAALKHHYSNEPHHPQYYERESGAKGRMEMRYLEESLVDMAAFRWERQLEGNEDATERDIVNFNSWDLKRYHPRDRETIQTLIEKIQDNDENEKIEP